MTIQGIFKTILLTSAMGSVVAVMIMAVKALFKDRLSPIWHYYIWLIVIIRLLIPNSFSSTYSIFNLLNLPAYEGISSSQDILPAFMKNTPHTSPAQVDGHANDAQKTVDNDKINTSSEVSKENISKETISKEDFPETKHLSKDYYNSASIVWGFGTLLLILYFVTAYYTFTRKIKRTSMCPDQAAIDILEKAKKQMGIHRNMKIFYTDAINTPTLMGIIKPRIILPANTYKLLTEEEKNYILMHELIHLKRKDILLNWIIAVLQCIHWFNPILWFSFSRMRRDCELSCDAQTLMHIQPWEYKNYGETLLKLIKTMTKSQLIPGTTAAVSKSEIKRRIIMISKFKKRSFVYVVLALLVTALVGCAGLTNRKETKLKDNAQAVNAAPTKEDSKEGNTASPASPSTSDSEIINKFFFSNTSSQKQYLYKGTVWGEYIINDVNQDALDKEGRLPIAAKLTITELAKLKKGKVYELAFLIKDTNNTDQKSTTLYLWVTQDKIYQFTPPKELDQKALLDNGILENGHFDDIKCAKYLEANNLLPNDDKNLLCYSSENMKFSTGTWETEIITSGSICTYRSYNPGNSGGSKFIWETGKGLTDYYQGQGAMRAGFDLKLVE